jgi:hypothetical protein
LLLVRAKQTGPDGEHGDGQHCAHYYQVKVDDDLGRRDSCGNQAADH